MELGARITLEVFETSLWDTDLEVPAEVYARLKAARKVVDQAAAGAAPVYGLNTGLGANLDHRIAPKDIAAFQMQIVEGRAVAVGPMLPANVGRAVLLARIAGVAQGYSGISIDVFDHLCRLWRAGLAPGVPQFGSIGAADLTQNAAWALGALGRAPVWDGTVWGGLRLDPPELSAKDGMALINHSGFSVAVAGLALAQAREGLWMMRHAALSSCQGFGATKKIFEPDINALRPSTGQAEMAAWFHARLGADEPGARVQDALSFRTIAPVFGAAEDALQRAIDVWEDEINGASDNPAVLQDQAMCSTPNFHAPALALALEQVSLAMAMVAQSAVMRVQRLMDPKLSGLPRYLSPKGGQSAGFVPLQKTAAALLADIRRNAMPTVLDAAPVSEGVEDMAPMTPQAAQKLEEQMKTFHLLCGLEAVVAAQARDLRGLPASDLHSKLRQEISKLETDRPLGKDVETAAGILRAYQKAHRQ